MFKTGVDRNRQAKIILVLRLIGKNCDCLALSPGTIAEVFWLLIFWNSPQVVLNPAFQGSICLTDVDNFLLMGSCIHNPIRLPEFLGENLLINGLSILDLVAKDG